MNNDIAITVVLKILALKIKERQIIERLSKTIGQYIQVTVFLKNKYFVIISLNFITV